MDKKIEKTITFKPDKDNPDKLQRVVEKPITLIVEDFKNELVNVVNKSHLPFFVVESVVEKLLEDVKCASIRQLEADKLSYQAQLKEAEKQEA